MGNNEATIRLREWRERAGLSVEDIAAKLDISTSYLYQLERGEKRLNTTLLRKLAQEFSVSIDYLLGLEEWVSSRRIPVLGTIRAGIPILDQENITGYIEVPADLHADFAVQVVGDSMSWVGIREGDLAICRLHSTPRSGQIVAVSLGEAEWGATIKFYVEQNGRKLLRAANPAYQDIALDGREYRIAGVAIKFLKEPPALADYENALAIHEIRDKEWQEAIDTAAAIGITPEAAKKLFEAFGAAVENIPKGK